MVIEGVDNALESFAYLCCVSCLTLPIFFILCCLILALAHVKSHVGLKAIFNKPLVYAIIIIGLAIILPLDLVLMPLFGRKHKVVKSWVLEKYSEDNLAGPRISLSPDGGIYVINDISGCCETVVQRYDKDGKYLKSLNVVDYVYKAVNDDNYRKHTYEGEFNFHDLDVSPFGDLLILASIRSMDLSDSEEPEYDDYYTGPQDTIILKIDANDDLISLIRVDEELRASYTTQIVAADDSIYLSGSGRIYKIDYNGKAVSFYDLPINSEKKVSTSAICVSSDYVIVANVHTKDIIFLTKELRPVRQWKAGFLDKRDSTVHTIGSDKDNNVYLPIQPGRI